MTTLPLSTSWFWTWEKKTIHPSSWADHSSTPPTPSSTSDLDKSTSNSLEKRYPIILIVIPLISSRRSPALGGDIDHPETKRNEWEEDREPKGVVKDEPAPPKSSPQTKQVWKEKVTSSPESQKAQSSESPSTGPDDAPEERILLK